LAGENMADSGEFEKNLVLGSESPIISLQPNGHHETDNQETENIHPSEIHKPLSLQESEIRYRRLFETAQDGILILDADTGMITDVNPYLINMLGYSREELVTKNYGKSGLLEMLKPAWKPFTHYRKKNIFDMKIYRCVPKTVN
jgi:transcriptional regulator with PAS, ATPase and Fis domain